MRIALLFEFPTLNGGERSMLAVLDQLSGSKTSRARQEADDFGFVAIAPEAGPLSDALQRRGIEVRPLRIRDDAGRRLRPQSAAANLRETLAGCAADVVHANSLAMGRLTGVLGDDFPISRIAHLRDIIKLSAAAMADLNRNDRLIAVSHATREFHVAQGLDPAKTVVVYNGVDCNRFHPMPNGRDRRDLTGRGPRALLRFPEDAFIVLTVGQIGLRKGQDVLAEAAVSLKHSCEAASGDIHYVLVGERHSNKRESVVFEANVSRKFADAGLSDRLHLLGYRNDVPQLMHEADLLVHPAKQEPLGRVLLEAAASGLPIVATDVGGTAEILADGVSARLVPAGDPAALAAAILELATSRAQRARFAAAARQSVARRFSIANAAAALSNLWCSLR